jgi:hypothetical protein
MGAWRLWEVCFSVGYGGTVETCRQGNREAWLSGGLQQLSPVYRETGGQANKGAGITGTMEGAAESVQ